MSANLRSNQAFGAGLVVSERPARPVESGLFDVRKRRVPSGEAFVINTLDRRCSRIHICVISGTAHGYWSNTRGGSELPDFILTNTNGYHVIECEERPITLTLYAGGGEDLLVAVLLTNPDSQDRQRSVCGCHGGCQNGS